MDPRDSLAGLLEQRRILLCLGEGGVGKTTLSAAVALAGALRGRRVAVLTIDPARRLKDALGLPELGDAPVRVPIETLGEVPLRGELVATMLDAKRTFDRLVARFAPNLETARRILDNRVYRYVSGALAGSQEYMALEKVYEIATAGDYDLLVVDTPPTHHALDFLEAPGRMLDLLGSRALDYLRRPTLALFGAGSRIARAAIEAILRALERFTGMRILAEVADLVEGFEGMLGGFRDRADAVRRLLRDPGTAAVLVTSCEPLTVRGSVEFYRELDGAGMRVGAVVVNRTVPPEVLGRTRPRRADIPPPVRERLREAQRDLEALAERDRRILAELRQAIGEGVPIVPIPGLPRDVHSLGGLAAIARGLAPEGSRPAKVTPLRVDRRV